MRQNLTYKDGPHTESIKIFLMVVDPYDIGIQMNQKELERAN